LDLMNARAQVVDSWRQIAVTANALRGVFDVRYDLNTTSPRDEAAGLAFAGTRTQHTVTMRFEPPFVRRAERNAYRAALIGYQRSRRNLMAFEDNILADSRSDLRQLRQLTQSYKLQQRAVELAYAQVDNARSTLTAPPDPTARDTAAAQAALTEQLLSAQQALVQAQNTLYTTWMAFQATRMDYFLGLERLPLDARGLWTDERSDPALQEPGPAPRPAPPGGGERAPAPQPVPAGG
jgi:outer membrane protein TolC